MKNYLALAAAAALMLLAGLVHGHQTGRWAKAPEVDRAKQRLPKLPMTLGEWKGEEIVPDAAMNEQLGKVEAYATLMRRYTDPRTNESVQLMVLCGRTGPMVTHTPESCYDGGGHWLIGPAARRDFPGGPGHDDAAFFTGDFRRANSAIPKGLKIYWSWRGGQRWEAPEDPRFAFAPYRAIYKVYVIREVPMPDGAPVKDQVTPQFLRALMPELNDTLDSDPGVAAGPDGGRVGPRG